MGLFDTIKYKGKEYQTKSLECLMDVYTITESGRLVHDICHMETIPESEWPKDDNLSEFQKTFGKWRWVTDQKDVDTNYHGYLNFYTSNENGEWEEYNAKFTDGTLVEITPVKDNQNENTCPIRISFYDS